MVGRAIKPHCFCHQPATLVSTADHGNVYECHHTDTAVWNYRPVNHQKAVADYWNMVAPPILGSSASLSSPAQTTPSPGDFSQTVSTERSSASSPLTATTAARWPKATIASTGPAFPPSGMTNSTSKGRGGTRPQTCGFHVHVRDWTSYADIFCNRVHHTPQTEAISGFYYSQHYQKIAQDHPELHPQVVLMARSSSCEAQLASVARWLGWEAALGYPPLAAGEPPNCFCNRPMVLCPMRPTSCKLSMSYYCKERLRTNVKGCSRFLDIETTRCLRQPAKPYHALAADMIQESAPEPQGREVAAANTGLVTSAAIWATRLERRRALEQGLYQGYSGGDSVNNESTISNDDDDDDDIDDIDDTLPTDGDTEHFPGTKSTTDSQLSGCFGQDTMMPPPQSETLKTRLLDRLQELARQDRSRVERSRTKMKAKDEYLKSLNAFEVWEGSRDRLQAQVDGQHQLGLHNPELKCLACHEGTIDFAALPCYHMVMCSSCICDLKDCILCKVTIQRVQRVFWG